MKKQLSIIAAAALVLPCSGYAEQPDRESLQQQNDAITAPESVQESTDVQALPTLVVEGNTVRPGVFGTVPGSTGLKDTASMLKRVPGANVNRNGPLTGIAQYRGLAGNRINIDLDGANYKEVGPNSMDPPLSHVPAPLVKSLKVYRGIAPVSSGIETIGGSMKAKTKKGHFADGTGTKVPLSDGLETSGVITGGYSSVDDGWFAGGLAAIASKHHKIYGSGIKQGGRDYNFRHDKKVRPTQYRRGVWSVGYGYQRDGHELGVDYNNTSTGKTGTPALPMDIIYIRGGQTNAHYQWDLDNGQQLQTEFYYQNLRHLMDNFDLRAAPTLVTGPMKGMQRTRQNRTTVDGGGLNLGYTLPLFSGDLKIGFNGDQSNHDALITDPNNANFFIKNFNGIERDRYSFYGEWEGDINEDFGLEFGARFINANTNSGTVDFNGLPMMAAKAATSLRNNFNNAERDQTNNMVDVVAILRYAMTSSIDWELGFARKNRAPSYQERYLWLPLEATSGLADGHNYIGSIDLDNETAYQAELGFDWHAERAYFTPRAFYHYINNYIQGTPTSNMTAQNLSNMVTSAVGGTPQSVLQFSNINARLYGVDFEAGYALTDQWRLDGGLNYVRGKRVGSVSDNLYRIAPLNGRAQLSFAESGWTAGIEGVFYARQDKVSSFNNEKQTPGYALLNLRGSYKPVRGMVIGFGIENVLDKQHFNHLGGYSRISNVTSPDVVKGGRIPMHGRNVYATLAYSW